MRRRTRLWVGVTLLAVITINYGIFALPLVKRRRLIENRENAILARQVKEPRRFNRHEEEYLLEIFRKERNDLDRKVRNLNGIALTGVVVVLSWTVFGLVVRGK